MEERLQLVYDLALPSVVKSQINNVTTNFLDRMTRLGGAQVFVHLKHEGSQVLCQLTMLTNNGKYHAKTLGWDVHRTVSEAIDNAEAQFHKHIELHAHAM